MYNIGLSLHWTEKLLKVFILGQKFSEKFHPMTIFFEINYPTTDFFEKFCPRIKFCSENFCPMWGRANFIWVGQKFSEKFCPRTWKNFFLGQIFYLMG